MKKNFFIVSAFISALLLVGCSSIQENNTTSKKELAKQEGSMPDGQGFPGGGFMPDGQGFPDGGFMPDGQGFPDGGFMPDGQGFPDGGFMPDGQMKGDFKGGPNGSGGPPKLDTSTIKTKYTDIAYADKSKTEKLDIYLPNEGKGPFPVIIEFHPGGFFIGEKSSFGLDPILKGAIKRGYAVVSVGYRLSGEAKFPAALNDAKGAIKFLRANAAKYNLDPNKFATWGESAGSNLSAMIAVSSDIKELEDTTMGYNDVSTKVQAAIDWFGPLSFATMDAEFKALGKTAKMGVTNSEKSAESRYIGKIIGTTEANILAEKTNPNNYITKDDTPMYIEHGTADTNVPITQSINFSKNLAKVIGEDKVFFTPIEGEGHGGKKFETDENINKMLDFLDKYLKGN